MKTISLGNSGLASSRLTYGCMRLVGDSSPEAKTRGMQALDAAIAAGYNHFDHADIYTDGACESLFGSWLKEHPGLREKLIITSKCGIRFAGKPLPESPARYDFSEAHILESVEGSLRRLGIDTLDILLLHRPDYLFHAEEVSRTLQKLHQSGKVRSFGVSNFSVSQLELLNGALPYPLVMHQVEINIHRLESLKDGTLDQCQRLGVTPQAWCPLGGVAYEAWGNTLSEEAKARLAKEFIRQSRHYGVPNTVIMLAWILKLPSAVVPVIGSTTPSRIAESTRALYLEYAHDDWYRLLEARNGHPVP